MRKGREELGGSPSALYARTLLGFDLLLVVLMPRQAGPMADEPTSEAPSPFPVLHVWDLRITCGVWDADLFINKEGRLMVALAQQVGLGPENRGGFDTLLSTIFRARHHLLRPVCCSMS
jgi:hypothetical protein